MTPLVEEIGPKGIILCPGRTKDGTKTVTVRVEKHRRHGKQKRWIVYYQQSWGKARRGRDFEAPLPEWFRTPELALVALRKKFKPKRNGWLVK